VDWVALSALPAILVGGLIVFVLSDYLLTPIIFDSAFLHDALVWIGCALIVFGFGALVAVDLWRAAMLFW
jgi:hypothetical protein